MIYVVLGFGFSGTTLLSELIHHSGIKMIDEETDTYDNGGKYEHPVFQQINKEILDLANNKVYHLRINDCPALLQESYKDRMLSIINKQIKNHEHWGFKDPRTVVTYPLWHSVLPEHKIIAIYRHPAGNWSRHRWRGLRKRYSNAWRAYIHLRQWYEYNEAILDIASKSGENFLLLSYEKLMQDDTEIKNLKLFIEKTVKDMRKANMHRCQNHADMLFRLVQWFMRFTPYPAKDMLRRLQDIQMKQSHDFNKINRD